MKPGDIVEVCDGSWAMAIVNGDLECASGHDQTGRRFRVLATGGDYPNNEPFKRKPNDVMAVDENRPGYVLFTRQKFCRVVTPAPDAPLDTMDITIPHEVTTVKLHFVPCSTCGEEVGHE